ILALIVSCAEKSSYYRNIVLTKCADRPSLCAFFKAIQQDDCADEKEIEILKGKSEPLILELGLLIEVLACKYDMGEVIYRLGLSISKLRKEVEAEAQNDRLYRPLLLLVENAVLVVKIKQESPAALQHALDNFVEENGRLNSDTALRCYHNGECLSRQMNYEDSLRYHYEALDIRLKLYGHNLDIADNYYQIGYIQYFKNDYESALKSFKKALVIRQNLHGKIHPVRDVFRNCHEMIGTTEYYLKEYDSAVHWHQLSLDISVALYEKEHPVVADSYFSIAKCQCEMQDYDSALESCQHALDIRLKLFEQECVFTSNSYDQMEFIRTNLKKVCESSLELQSKNSLSYFKKKKIILRNFSQINPNFLGE
ncbi:nephrocystin-3-like, partial, partial [Paramuricea clavata]